MKNILYTIILSFLFSSSALAEIYKWVDDEGNVHYGEKLPDNAESKSIKNIKTKDDDVLDNFQAGFDAYKKGNYLTALKIYRAAAEQGDIMGQFTLGTIYHTPGKFKKHGVKKDHKESAKWFHLAAEQGEDMAQFFLGQKYEKGKGVTKNLVIAHMWLSTAEFSNKNIGAYYVSAIKNKRIAKKDLMKYLEDMRDRKKNKVRKLENQMTPEQITKAEQLARECIKKNYKDCG